MAVKAYHATTLGGAKGIIESGVFNAGCYFAFDIVIALRFAGPIVFEVEFDEKLFSGMSGDEAWQFWLREDLMVDRLVSRHWTDEHNMKEDDTVLENGVEYFNNNIRRLSIIDEIKQERSNQINNGYDSNHDDNHTEGEIRKAAICYAISFYDKDEAVDWWPWDSYQFKHKKTGRDALIVAAALLVAEIERLDRIDI